MDTFENNDAFQPAQEEATDREPAFQPEPPAPQPEQPVSQQAPVTEPRQTATQPQQPSAETQDTLYHGSGTGRRESPYGENARPFYGYTQPRQEEYAPRGYYQQPRYQGSYYQNPPQQAPGSRAGQPNYYQPGYYPPQTPPPKPPVKRKKEHKKGGIWKSIVAAVLILALVGGSCYATGTVINQKWESRTQQITDSFNNQLENLQQQLDSYSNDATGTSVSGTANTNTSGGGLTPAQVYAQNVQSVVAISSTVTTSYYGQTASGTSTGSGFIVTEDGYVVTNYHVVEDATSISVTTNSGDIYSAKLVGGDSTNDVAVLKVEAQNLPAVKIGSSSDLIVGDQVVAVGNPLGELTNTLTVGYVSAKDRMVTTDGFAINMLQTDAAINSGNSGGPLFNMNGEVVGITSAKYSGESSSGATIEGIGFAIPIDDVYSIVEDLIQYGYVTGAYLGVSVSDMDSSAASYYGMPVGAYVREVTEGYAAQKAGLQVKDIIVAIGEYEVNGVTALTRALRHFKAGDTTTITVFRSGVELVLTITMDEKPDTTQSLIPQSNTKP